MKRIIIPMLQENTAVELLKLTMQLYPQPLSVSFVKICALPDNFNDLTTLSRNKQQNHFETGFVKNIQEIQAGNSAQLQEVQFDYIYGSSAAVFRNYALGRNADLIFYCHHHAQQETVKMLLRSKLPLLYANKIPVCTEVPLPAKNNSDYLKQLNEPVYELEEVATAQHYQRRTSNTQVIQKNVPDSIVQQFALLENALTSISQQLQHDLYCTRQMNYLQRYFLNSHKLNNLLQQENKQLLMLL